LLDSGADRLLVDSDCRRGNVDAGTSAVFDPSPVGDAVPPWINVRRDRVPVPRRPRPASALLGEPDAARSSAELLETKLAWNAVTPQDSEKALP